MPTVSIIIPVYNTEKYLRKCLDSIISQTYTDFEAILVDDGSTDGSGKICDDYVVKDKRFRVFHKSNGGVSSARNLALDNIQGKWFTFVDSDDAIAPIALETFVGYVSDDVDCVEASYIKVDEYNNDIQPFKKVNIKRVLSFEEALIDFYKPIRSDQFNGYLVTRLFRAEVAKRHRIRFDELIYIKEDGLFFVEYICKSAKNVCYCSDAIYYYIQHSSSAMNRLDLNYNPMYVTDIDSCVRSYQIIKQKSFNKELLNISKIQIYTAHRLVLRHLLIHKIFNLKKWKELFSKTLEGISFGYLLRNYFKSFFNKIVHK